MFCSIKTSTEDFPAMLDSSDERLRHCLMKQAIWEDITFQTHPHIISSGFILFLIDICHEISLVGGTWWYTYPSEKYEFVSWGYKISNIWKNKIMFQSTNQIIVSLLIPHFGWRKITHLVVQPPLARPSFE
jgi:hypothetical protein